MTKSQRLKTYIIYTIEGVIGLAIVSGVVAVGAALVAAVVKRSK